MKVKFWIVLLTAASVSFLVGYGIGTGARCVVNTVGSNLAPSVGAESLTGVTEHPPVSGVPGTLRLTDGSKVLKTVEMSTGLYAERVAHDTIGIVKHGEKVGEVEFTKDDIKITCDHCEVVDYAGKRCEWDAEEEPKK